MWSQFALFTKCYEGDKTMGDETAVACSTHESSEEFSQKLVGRPEGEWPLGMNWCKLQNINTLRTGLSNCLNARFRGLTFRHRASCI
jgi:hypothetical protein